MSKEELLQDHLQRKQKYHVQVKNAILLSADMIRTVRRERKVARALLVTSPITTGTK